MSNEVDVHVHVSVTEEYTFTHDLDEIEESLPEHSFMRPIDHARAQARGEAFDALLDDIESNPQIVEFMDEVEYHE